MPNDPTYTEEPTAPVEMKEATDIRAITEQIGKLYEAMKKMVEASQQASKPMDGEEEQKYSRMNARLTQLIQMRDQHYRQLDAGVQAIRAVGKIAENAERNGAKKAMNFSATDEYRNAFGKYIRHGASQLSQDESRAMSEGTDGAGGYLPAIEFLQKLIEARFQANTMRQIMNVIPLGTFQTQVVYEDTVGASSYIAEAGAANEVTPAFLQVVLKPNTLRYFTKVSNELLSDSPSRGAAFNVETILASQIGRSMGEAEERKFCTGSGSDEPKGIYSFTSTRVITKTTTATNNVLVASDLINTIAALPRQYREGAKWIMSDLMFYKIRALLQTSTLSSVGTTYAPYAWSMGDGKLQDGEPDRLLGYPIVCVNDGLTYPASGTAKIMGCFGNFDYFHLGEREGVSIKVAKETYLANNQTGFFAFARHGSDVSQLKAFNYLEIKGT